MPAQYRIMRAPKESARNFAYRILEMYIREMRLLPGDKLSEAETSARLGISRTPVHDTFAQLAREKMLSVEPQRGTFVPLLDAGQILQVARICKNLYLATLETIYGMRPTAEQLAPLYSHVKAEHDALAKDTLGRMARLSMEFYRELFVLSGYLPVYYSIRRIDADLYRLYRLIDDTAFWQDIVDGHTGIANALKKHDNDTACCLTERQYAMVKPLLERMRTQHPNYFK